jgi:hypothetical protein
MRNGYSSIFSTALRLFHNPKYCNIFQDNFIEAEFLDVIGTKEFSSLLFTVTSTNRCGEELRSCDVRRV